jgi:hypothetical protein
VVGVDANGVEDPGLEWGAAGDQVDGVAGGGEGDGLDAVELS